MKIIKFIKILGVCISTMIFMALCISGLDYVLSDDTGSWTRIAMHELYEQEKIDSIFLGASHVYSSLDPSVTDEIWNQNTFNCGSSSQRMNTSYALLKEADRVADVDRCYLELTMSIVVKEIRDEQTPEVYNVSDYMKLSWNKISYLLGAIRPADYVNAFCRARRNWKNIYDANKIKEITTNKSQDIYKYYGQLNKGSSYYAGKGFIYAGGTFKNVAAASRTPYEGPISDDSVYYFQKIVRYCRENDIELICFSIPLPEYTVESAGNYDEYYTQAKELCDEYDVPYYDFNLANPDVLKIQDSDFRDANHLNGGGGEKFTKVFADFFAGKIKKEELFYDSYAEKRVHLPKRLIGLAIRRDESMESSTISVVASKEDEYQYEVYYKVKKKGYVLLREKSPDRKIAMPTKEKIRLKVKVFDSNGNEVGKFSKRV